MSYILDALKKADAEREREAAAVPDLHAQADAADDRTRMSARRLMWPLLAAAVVLGALAWLAWPWFGAATVEPISAAAPMPVPVPAPVAVQVPEQPPLQVPAQAPVQAPVQMPTPVPVPSSQPSVATAPITYPAVEAAPAGPLPAARPRALPATTAAPARALPPPGPASPPGPKPTAAPAAAEPRLPTLAELPADLRAQLPALAVGGSVYSPTAASRIVILNGQVFREGDHPIEGLTVEQIRLKSTVLAFRGARFELKH